MLTCGYEALYIARWKEGCPEFGIAFLICYTGEDCFVSILYSFEHESFMVVGEEGYDWQMSNDKLRILRREEVIGQPFSSTIFSLLDEIWLHDPNLIQFVNEV